MLCVPTTFLQGIFLTGEHLGPYVMCRTTIFIKNYKRTQIMCVLLIWAPN